MSDEKMNFGDRIGSTFVGIILVIIGGYLTQLGFIWFLLPGLGLLVLGLRFILMAVISPPK